MRVMKHFAEVIGRKIKAGLEAMLAKDNNKKKRATSWRVRDKMRRLYSMWEQMHINIADEVKDR